MKIELSGILKLWAPEEKDFKNAAAPNEKKYAKIKASTGIKSFFLVRCIPERRTLWGADWWKRCWFVLVLKEWTKVWGPVSGLTAGHWASLSAATIWTLRCLAWDLPRDLINRCRTCGKRGQEEKTAVNKTKSTFLSFCNYSFRKS